MANDLLIMSCKHCRKWIPLAKYFPSTGLSSRAPYPSVHEFIDQHTECSHEYLLTETEDPHDLGGDPQFELHTEDAFPEILKWENQDTRVEDSIPEKDDE